MFGKQQHQQQQVIQNTMSCISEIEVPFEKSLENMNNHQRQQQQYDASSPTTTDSMEEIRKVLLQTFQQQDEETCENFQRRRSSLELKASNSLKNKDGSTPETSSIHVSHQHHHHTADLDESVGGGEFVVLYDNGATPLFQSLEEGQWDAATEILRHQPEQAKIWVESTGTVDTTFQWSLFKRLPLHEAVRRQAPLPLLIRLLRAYPDAVRSRTQFGELPLHLAIESGASLVTVNLLTTHHWMGCHSQDQSGRTPLDILNEAELLDPEEQLAVTESLRSTERTWGEIQAHHAAEMAALRIQHASGLQAVRQQHDDDLAVEQQQQEKLLDQVMVLQQQLAQEKEAAQILGEQLICYKEEELEWLDKVSTLRKENSALRHTVQFKDQDIGALRDIVARKESEAVDLKSQIARLQSALRQLEKTHRNRNALQLDQVNNAFQMALKQLETLNVVSATHSECLETFVAEIGGEADDSTGETEDMAEEIDGVDLESQNDEEDSMNEQEEDVPEEEAMLRAALAASNAL